MEPPGPPKRLKETNWRALSSPCSANFAPLSLFEMEACLVKGLRKASARPPQGGGGGSGGGGGGGSYEAIPTCDSYEAIPACDSYEAIPACDLK